EPAGNKSDRTGYLRSAFELDVNDESVTPLANGVLHPIDSDINHGRSLTNEFRSNEMWTADGGDDHVGPPANFNNIPGAGMDHRDGCVDALSHEQKRHWLSDDHAATEHGDVGSGEGNAGFAEQTQTTEGGARDKTGVVDERKLRD